LASGTGYLLLYSFDEISHKWLLTNTPVNQAMLQPWLKAGIIDRQTFKPTLTGAPQGSPISPVLANLTLDGLEQHLARNIPKITTEGRYSKVHLIRFADDFVRHEARDGYGAQAPTVSRRTVSLSA
jgi:RNA-directed DNA polymerase